MGADGKAVGGNATERALLESVADLPPTGKYRVFSRLLFTSERKYAAVSYKGANSLTFLLGAPEKLLPSVGSALRADGSRGTYAKKQVEK